VAYVAGTRKEEGKRRGRIGAGIRRREVKNEG